MEPTSPKLEPIPVSPVLEYLTPATSLAGAVLEENGRLVVTIPNPSSAGIIAWRIILLVGVLGVILFGGLWLFAVNFFVGSDGIVCFLLAMAVAILAISILVNSIREIAIVSRLRGQPSTITIHADGMEVWSIRSGTLCDLKWKRDEIARVELEMRSSLICQLQTFTLRVREMSGRWTFLVCERPSLELPQDLRDRIARYLPPIETSQPESAWPVVYAI